jgi:hypothetical protein
MSSKRASIASEKAESAAMSWWQDAAAAKSRTSAGASR